MSSILSKLAPEGFVSTGTEDVHVHTSFCNDATLDPNAALTEANIKNLRWVCFTAHVRKNTNLAHIQSYLDATSEAAKQFSDITTTYSIETKILNTSGKLDLPDGVVGLDLDTLHISDHQFPLDQPTNPTDLSVMLKNNQITEEEAFDALAMATCQALLLHPSSILAHPFSVVPKAGLSADAVPTKILAKIAATALRTNTIVEVNNKWSCPSMDFLKLCAKLGVPIVSASDAHREGEVGHSAYLSSLGDIKEAAFSDVTGLLKRLPLLDGG